MRTGTRAEQPLQLNSDVGRIYAYCLANDNDPLDQRMTVRSIDADIDFNKVRVDESKTKIQELTRQFHRDFDAPKAAHFKETNVDRRGHLWSGPSSDAPQRQVVALGIATGDIQLVPYISVLR